MCSKFDVSVKSLFFYSVFVTIGKHEVSGIECYQCSSTDRVDPFQCSEFMEDSELTPKSCDSVYNAAYCIKETGRFEGGLGTKRYCSSLDLGNYCNYIKQPGDELEYRSCVYTCDEDGCNAASRLNTQYAITYISAAATLLLLVRN